MKKQCYISTDKAKLNISFIHKYLSEVSYWAKGRSLELVEISIENSICFGVYNENDQQVGFARVVTDYVVFAWLMDVFIDTPYRGKGFGKMLIDHIMKQPNLKKVNGIGLRTNDGHNLYRKYGFNEIPNPETWMLKKSNITNV